MTNDELEFSISQYCDGVLAGPALDVLEDRLATDADARGLLSEYQAVNSALQTAALPAMEWEAIGARISAAIARQPMPAQSYRISQWLRPAAIAASVVLAAGIGYRMLSSSSTSTKGHEPAPLRIVQIDPAHTVAQPLVPANGIQVAIGPSDAVRDTPMILRYTEGVVARPSRAIIASAATVAQDSMMTPY